MTSQPLPDVLEWMYDPKGAIQFILYIFGRHFFDEYYLAGTFLAGTFLTNIIWQAPF